jgi:methylenetetrahydrofolate reductase (NADPH)
MRISEAYGHDRFGLSFELFPPKTDAGIVSLREHVDVLCRYGPSFITCTYGAGGSTREKTPEILSWVKQTYDVPVASHLTCVGSTVDDLRDYLRRMRDLRIENIVALRGDPPRGSEQFQAVPGGLRYASELVTLIHADFPTFGIAVAGYPETHQESPDAATDLRNLKHKVDCGADVVITQLFYDNDDFFAFRDRCDRIGIRVPIVPGLLPVTNLSQIQRITSLCGAKLPSHFLERLAMYQEPEWQFCVGVAQAIDQVDKLLRGGIPGIHFYVLNKSEATEKVLKAVTRPAQVN